MALLTTSTLCFAVFIAGALMTQSGNEINNN